MSDKFVEILGSLTENDLVKINSNKPFVVKEIIPHPTSHTIYGIVIDPKVGVGGIRMFQLREIELDAIGGQGGANITIEKAEGGDNLDETSLGQLISRMGSAGGGGVRKRIKKRRTKRRRTKRRRTKRR